MENEKIIGTITRRKISIDMLSLEESDITTPSPEDEILGEISYREILRTLPSDREKFIALALDCKFSNNEIAFMLGVHFSRVSHIISKMRQELRVWRTGRTIIGRSKT
jgi:DNA-directed RNA polymerase specialized sigma24 family protein